MNSYDVIDRRRFIVTGLWTLASGFTPGLLLASTRNSFPKERWLSFHNSHTEENLTTAYWYKGRYSPKALAEINYILRDHRTEDIKPIDKDLLDLLFILQKKLKYHKPYHVISGYRSPKTNALLRKKSRNVAAKSMHMYGKAIDIRLPGYNLAKVRKTAIQIQRGGVGYYPRSDFIHLDVGRVRFW